MCDTFLTFVERHSSIDVHGGGGGGEGGTGDGTITFRKLR